MKDAAFIFLTACGVGGLGYVLGYCRGWFMREQEDADITTNTTAADYTPETCP